MSLQVEEIDIKILEEVEATEEEVEVTEEVSWVVEDDEEEDGENDALDDDPHDQDVVEIGALTEVLDQTFEQMSLPADTVAEVQRTWSTFINSASSRQAAGEAIYAAIFDSAPSLQSLFKTPRAVMSMRILAGFNNIVGDMLTPAALKTTVETLGFQHLDLDVTVPRVVIFRDAIVELLEMELGAGFTSKAKSGWNSILNFVGGAFIYVRREYAGRLKIIASSWATANKKEKELDDGDGAEGDGDEAGEVGEGEKDVGETDAGIDKGLKESSRSGARASGDNSTKVNSMKVPTTFREMFLFNGAVMGFGNSHWMQEVLESFDDMVNNVANSYRLQEECDTLSLRIAKYKGNVNLAEFRSVMLASLRSLVPKEWNSAHEVAWTWLWENIGRMLKANMGKPQVQEKALAGFMMSLTEDSQNYFRGELYRRFFAAAPGGQDYFKQSTTRLYFLADKVVDMTIEMYRDPRKMVEEISALGLRHVGYGIPTEFFAPYVSSAVDVVRTMTTNENAEDGFRWSLSLISRMLVRTINEGSTIVMKAINTNSARQLEKAVACAPRGKRAMWLLNVTVGTQSISPLYWSIESGSLESARAMILDLLTIRADRDNYYYGCNDLFERHPDVIRRLCADAVALLPVLLDGLIWRSRLTQGGQRRVNFYIKHLIQDELTGNFSQTLEWLVDAGNPKILCHPAVVLFSDLVWSQLANRPFLLSKCWTLLTLAVFIVSQSILQHFNEGDQNQETRTTIFVLRCFIYLGSLGQLVRVQVREALKDIRAGNLQTLGGIIRVPAYLTRWTNSVSLVLMLVLMLMLSQEPILWCLRHYDPDVVQPKMFLANMAKAAVQVPSNSSSSGGRLLAATIGSDGSFGEASAAEVYIGKLFTQHCPEGVENLKVYAPCSLVAILLYWTLIVDLTVFSTRISAFVLVCRRVISELGLFLMAAFVIILGVGSAISTLNLQNKDFEDIPNGMLSLTMLTLSLYPTGHFQEMRETPVVLICVGVFIILVMFFLLSLLVAQLNLAYQAVYTDMVGYARLSRCKIIVASMPMVSEYRWKRWLATLKLDEHLEFNEGDIGLPGGIQVLEPANANPINVDMICRFGGSTSPSLQWPEEEGGNDESDKFDRLEKAILRATKKMGGGREGGKSGGSSSMGQSGSSGGSARESEDDPGSQ
ncbi:unnamed protein product [Polarella glacialis]|uniref:Globin domain-containing protein n=1 Tax=Polarella glacialis TaxID=89957 RepID=A0A813LIC3_POLGL|nr:unnamed protein product [Polarella glacialis]